MVYKYTLLSKAITTEALSGLQDSSKACVPEEQVCCTEGSDYTEFRPHLCPPRPSGRSLLHRHLWVWCHGLQPVSVFPLLPPPGCCPHGKQRKILKIRNGLKQPCHCLARCSFTSLLLSGINSKLENTALPLGPAPQAQGTCFPG